jgi:hypothetical protein
MQCRKRLSCNGRCFEKVHTDSTQGYCQYHWHCYQIGLDFHDPSYDYDYEDPILKEYLDNFIPDLIDSSKNYLDDSPEIIEFKELPRDKNINLESLAKDKQNVHTKPIVETVLIRAKELISLSKNSSDEDVFYYLLSDELLSAKAKENMNSYFYSNDSIYDLTKSTYKSVLQGLWKYIQSKPPTIREEMIERLRQELEDNVGTCAQGNVSRLTNVLNGYDKKSVEPQLSLSDIMAQISKEKNPSIRKKKARETLTKHKVSKEEYEAWMEAIESY